MLKITPKPYSLRTDRFYKKSRNLSNKKIYLYSRKITKPLHNKKYGLLTAFTKTINRAFSKEKSFLKYIYFSISYQKKIKDIKNH